MFLNKNCVIINLMEYNVSKQFENYFIFVLLLLAGFVVAYIFFPYLSAIVFAITFAVIFSPLYRWLKKHFKKGWLASIISVLIVLIAVLLPIGFIIANILTQAMHIYSWFTSGNQIKLGDIINNFISQHLSGLNLPPIDITGYLSSILSWMVQNLWPFVGGVAHFALMGFLSLLGMFYLLKDGGGFKNKILLIIPLEQEYSNKIFDKMERAIYSVIGGSIMIAFIHGIEVIVGFYIFGIPNAAFWGSFAVITALIPTVGTSLINIPAIIYLFLNHNIPAAIGLLIWWGVVSFGFVDNFLSPQILHHGMKVHPFLILLSVLGGISVFGIIGFLIGPLMLAFFLALIDIYPFFIYGNKSE